MNFRRICGTVLLGLLLSSPLLSSGLELGPPLPLSSSGIGTLKTFEGEGQSVKKVSVNFNEPVTGTAGQYTALNIEGCSAREVSGYQLPVKSMSIELPAGSSLSSVKITGGQWRTIAGDLNLPPATLESQDEGVIDSFLPGTFIEAGQAKMAGETLVSVKIFPVQYNPETKKAIFLQSADIEISYGQETAAVPQVLIPQMSAAQGDGVSAQSLELCVIITPRKYESMANTLKNIHETQTLGPGGTGISTLVVTLESIAALPYGETSCPPLAALPDGLSPEGGFTSRTGTSYPNRERIAQSYNNVLAQKVISFLLDCHDAPGYKQSGQVGAAAPYGYYTMPQLQHVVLLGNGAEIPASYYIYSTVPSEFSSDSYEHWVPTDYFYSACSTGGLVDLNPYVGVGRFPVSRAVVELTDELYLNRPITALNTTASTITITTDADPSDIQTDMTVVVKSGLARNRWLDIHTVGTPIDLGGGLWSVTLTLQPTRRASGVNVAWMTEPAIAVGDTVDIIDTRPQMTSLITKLGNWVTAISSNNAWFKSASFAGGSWRNSFYRSDTATSSLQFASSSTLFWDELSCVEAINKVDTDWDDLSYVSGLKVRKYFATDRDATGGRLGGDTDMFITGDVANILSNNSAHRAGIFYFAGEGWADYISLENDIIVSTDFAGYGTSTYNNFSISLAGSTAAFDEEVWFGSSGAPISFGKASLLSPAGSFAYFGPTRGSYQLLNWSRAEDGLLIHSQEFANELAICVLQKYHRAGDGNPTLNAVVSKGLGQYFADNPESSSNKYHFRTLVEYNLLGSPAIYIPGPGENDPDYEYATFPTAEPLNPDRVNSDLVPCYEVEDGLTKQVDVSYSSEGSSNEITLVDPRYQRGDHRVTGSTSGTYNVPAFDEADTGATDATNGPGLYFVRVSHKEKDAALDSYTKENRYYFEVVNKFLASGDILIVDDDQPRRYTSSTLSGFDSGWQGNYPDYESYYTSALPAGKTYKVWHVENKNGSNAAGQGRHGEVTPAVLNSYIGTGKAVVWFTGNDFFTTVLPNEQTALEDFLNSEGKLFLTGQDIGWNIRTSSFYSNVLKAGYVQDNIRIRLIDGITLDPLSAGLANITISGGDGANNQLWPSEIDAQGNAELTLLYAVSGGGGGKRLSSGGAGIRCLNANNGAHVYFSFGFEAINHPDNAAYGRSSVMAKVLEWLGSPTETGGTFTATPGDTLVDLAWINPNPAGYPGVLILARQTDGYPTGVPANGTAYTAGAVIGDGTVIYSQTPAGASYTHTGLTNGITYYYYAYVFNVSLTYVPLGTASATPQEGVIPGGLSAPTNLIATSSQPGGQWQIDLSWLDNSADEDGFEIERRIGAGAFTPLATVGANVEAYTDGPPLAADTLYTYRVRAFRNDPPMVYSVWSNEASAATSILAAPTNLNVTGGEREAFLYWTNNSPGALGFEIQRSHLSPVSPVHSFTTIGYATAGSVSYRDELTSSPNIPDGRPYYYRIRAYDGLTETDWSEIAWTNPIPSAFPYGEDPTNFEILPGWNTIVVRFNDNTTNESSYVLEFWKKIPNNVELPYSYAYLPAFAGATYHESAFEISEGGTFYVRLIAFHSTTNYGYSRYATPAGGGSGYVTIELPEEAGAGGSGGSCFIATAAFGSPYERHVKTLRGFRDRHLLTNKPGRAFVRWYYRHSPSLADCIRRRPAARVFVRTLLRPVAWLVSLL